MRPGGGGAAGREVEEAGWAVLGRGLDDDMVGEGGGGGCGREVVAEGR